MEHSAEKPSLTELLEATGIEFELLDCDPELADTKVYCEHYGCEPADCANTILVKSKTGEEKFAACVALAISRLDVNNTIRKKLGARKASFASEQETQRLTNMKIGGVTAIGLPEEIPLWVDSAVMERKLIILGGASRSVKIRISPQVFLHLPNTEIVENLARSLTPQ